VLSHLCPKNLSTAPPKNCYANSQNYLASLTPASNYYSKNPGFRELYFAGRNEFRFYFHLINTKKFLSLLAVGFCPKKLSFCPKNNGFARVSPFPPGEAANLLQTC